MKITAESIVSNSDMIKNYKNCRTKAGSFGKIVILKNNQPDAVLFSIAEYERLSEIIERIEGLDEQSLVRAANLLSAEMIR
jgi:PHD/YefM family antitoxin component YafN of YafNO toxin-antitoxin module